MTALTPQYSFGLKSDVRNGVLFVDDTTIVYTTGSNIVFFDTENKSQKFFSPLTHPQSYITSIACHGDKKLLLVAEKTPTRLPTLTLYDLDGLKKKKSFTIPVDSTEEKTEVVLLTFSKDARQFLCQLSNRTYTLCLFSCEKSKYQNKTDLLSMMDRSNVNDSVESLNYSQIHYVKSVPIGVSQLSFHPTDENMVCVSGRDLFVMLKPFEDSFRSVLVSKNDVKGYPCHSWTIDDKLLATNDARIFFLENNGDCKDEIINRGDEDGSPKAVRSLLTFSKGFICGCAGGTLAIYEKNEDEGPVDEYKKTKVYMLGNELSSIIGLAINITEDLLVAFSDDHQIFIISIGVSSKPEDSTAVTLPSFHPSMINGVDVCIRKPLAITCGTDRSVRVWNYIENSCELAKIFSEDVYCCSFHPTGLYILIGFSGRLRMMNLLLEDMKSFVEFPIMGCQECKFSNGGQIFAAVHGTNIQIFCTWTFEPWGHLKGHSGKIKCLYFTPDDSRLISADSDGAIYEWSLKEVGTLPPQDGGGIKQIGKYLAPSCIFSSLASSKDGKLLYAVGNDQTLKVIRDSALFKSFPIDIPLTQLVVSHSGKYLYAGTTNGSIRAYSLPLNLEATTLDYVDVRVHQRRVTRLSLSWNDETLFSGSEDGSFYILSTPEKQGEKSIFESSFTNVDEILVNQAELDSKNSQIKELKARVDELKQENEDQHKVKDLLFGEKIGQLKANFERELNALQSTCSTLKADRDRDHLKHSDRITDEKDTHARRVNDLHTNSASRLKMESEKQEHLEIKIKVIQEEWKVKIAQTKAQKSVLIKELTSNFEELIKKKSRDVDELQEQIKTQQLEFETTQKDREEDIEQEMLTLKTKYEAKIAADKIVLSKLNQENSDIKQKLAVEMTKVEQIKIDIENTRLEGKRLQQITHNLDKDIEALKRELEERDETIQDKEKRIFELKKKNQELEKFKFVLDYKIKELKKEIAPRENDIQAMTRQIDSMGVELLDFHKETIELDMKLAELKHMYKTAEKEAQKERDNVQSIRSVINALKEELLHIEPKKNIKSIIIKLYKKYCLSEKHTTEKMALPDHVRERDYLERKTYTDTKLDEALRKKHKEGNIRILKENIELLESVNAIRNDMAKASHMKPLQLVTELMLPKITEDAMKLKMHTLRFLVWFCSTILVLSRNFSILHITDPHVDPYYQRGATEGSQCHSMPLSIFKKKTSLLDSSSHAFGWPGSICDSPILLINGTFRTLSKKFANEVDFVFFTGDSSRHDRDSQIPRNFTDFSVSNAIMAQQFLDHFDLNRTMVLPCIGNWDTYPHNIVESGPNIIFDTLYDLWEPFFPPKASIEGAMIHHDFVKGGYYYREIVSNQLAVISMNTNYWSLENSAVLDCSLSQSDGSKHFAWLTQKLELLKRRKMKVYLLGHIPPVDPSSSPLYKPSCYSTFVNTMGQYHDLIVGSLFGHINKDLFIALLESKQSSHYQLVSLNADSVFQINLRLFNILGIFQTSPSVVPVYNPAFKTIQLSINDTISITEQRQYHLNLQKLNAEYDAGLVDSEKPLPYAYEGCSTKVDFSMNSFSPQELTIWLTKVQQLGSLSSTNPIMNYFKCLDVKTSDYHKQIQFSASVLTRIFTIISIMFIACFGWILYYNRRYVFGTRPTPEEEWLLAAS